jgi:uncharacterized membrane protein YwaF
MILHKRRTAMWLKNFLDYYYTGPAGDGDYGLRHFIWIFGTFLLLVVLYQYFKRKPKHARTVMVILCALLFLTRLTKQIYRAAAGIEDPALMALPWQLCTVMTFLMPVVVIFNIKRLKPVVYSLCMIGGIMTLFVGGYFGNAFLTIWEYEPMWAHMMLIIIPVIEMAAGNYKLEFKDAWQTVLGLFLCTAWALLADLVIFAGYDTNNSELMRNQLGFDIPGVPYQVLYVIVGVVFITMMYGIPTVYRKLRNKNTK